MSDPHHAQPSPTTGHASGILGRGTRRWALVGLLPSALFVFILLLASVLRTPFERFMMKVARVVVGGIADHLPAIAIASTLALLAVWLAIGSQCLLEGREQGRRG